MRKLKVGRRYIITGISPKSDWYGDRDYIIGKEFKVIEAIETGASALGRYEAFAKLRGTWPGAFGARISGDFYMWGFTARIIREREVCTCGAYKFPHRKGSGNCIADQGPFCGECGEPCGWKRIRVGTGCNDKPASSCCGEDVYMDIQMTRLAIIDCDGDLE